MSIKNEKMKRSKLDYEGLLPLVFLVGVFGFYISGHLEGGLNSLEGFGVSAIITLIILIGFIFIATYLDFKQEKQAIVNDSVTSINLPIKKESSQIKDQSIKEIDEIKLKLLDELKELTRHKHQFQSEIEIIKNESEIKVKKVENERRIKEKEFKQSNLELLMIMKEDSNRIDGLYSELTQIKELIKKQKDV